MNNPESFLGFNLNLLPGGKATSFRKGVKLGAAGVSRMDGFQANYNRAGANPLPPGPGVSRSIQPMKAQGPLRVDDYSIYDKGPGTAVVNRLYGDASNPRNPDILTKKLRR